MSATDVARHSDGLVYSSGFARLRASDQGIPVKKMEWVAPACGRRKKTCPDRRSTIISPSSEAGFTHAGGQAVANPIHPWSAFPPVVVDESSYLRPQPQITGVPIAFMATCIAMKEHDTGHHINTRSIRTIWPMPSCATDAHHHVSPAAPAMHRACRWRAPCHTRRRTARRAA